QMITGERPFEGETTVTLAYKIVQVEPIPPRILKIHIPQAIEDICKKALAKDPTLRFRSPLEMLEEIRAFRNREKTGKKPLVDTTIKTKVPVPGQVIPEELSVEKTQVAGVRIAVQSEISERKEPPKTSPPPPVEAAPPVVESPTVPKAAAEPQKSQETPLKTITIAICLVIIMVIGIVMLVRFAKNRGQVPGTVPGDVQITKQEPTQTLPSDEKSTSGLEAMIVNAKNQLQSNPAVAKKLLTQALELDPENFEANYQLGRLLTFQGDYRQAVPYYQKAQKLNPRVPEVSFNLGFIFMNQGDYDQAIQAYEASRALYPTFLDEVLTNLGFCYQKKNDLPKAQFYFREALKINPDNMIAQKYLKASGL
ncbi:MAG: tetratricopeptide repeat protein, partial [Thermodesulfobacteriota bacterium]